MIQNRSVSFVPSFVARAPRRASRDVQRRPAPAQIPSGEGCATVGSKSRREVSLICKKNRSVSFVPRHEITSNLLRRSTCVFLEELDKG